MLGKRVLNAAPRFLNQGFNGVGFFKIPGQLAALRPVLVENCRQASTSPRLWIPSLSQVRFNSKLIIVKLVAYNQLILVLISNKIQIFSRTSYPYLKEC